MHAMSVCVLVFILIPGYDVGIARAQNVVDGAQMLKNSLVKMAAKPVVNPYLDEFLDRHSQPTAEFSVRQNMYNLKIDSRYEFKPPIRFAPLPSVGEPWPLPKYYKSEKESVLKLDRLTFRMSVLNKTCDILKEAIVRYYTIISNYTLEEHYSFVHNFNNKTLEDDTKQREAKYKTVNPMPDLKIYMASDDCGYPDVEMNESYYLVLRPYDNRLVAKEIWGVLRGLETFSQLLFRKRDTNEFIEETMTCSYSGSAVSAELCKTDPIYARVTDISDEPRFPHRGILVDTSRHFIHMHTLKDVLDGMAYNKMNVLHWHIVDDNSFPYQSQVFPKLSEKGAFHPTLVYTHKDIAEIVEYARYRGIRVVPEFDSPGHTFSWLGYPEIKSTCYVQGKPLHGPLGPINPAQDETYAFMAKLFSEIYDVFPDKFVHLGGDELHSTCWATNPSIVAYLQQQANIPAHEATISNAQNYINKAIGYYFKRLIEELKKTAVEKNQTKRFILWEDVLKNTKEIPTESILQVWMGHPANVMLLNQQGYRALYSSCWYLDNYKREVMWQDYYNCEPSPYYTEAEEKGKLLGGEACLWAEFITTDTLMTFMWPRASAPAERLWSPKSTRDLVNAQMRIQEQRCRMIYRGLATGHISGPDYCLRPDKRRQGMDYTVEESTGEHHISLVVLSHYHHYLPLVHLVLSLIGVYFIVIASKCWKKKMKPIWLCPRVS